MTGAVMREELNWAVLGTGVIANEMAAALKEMGKTLYAVGNRTYDKAVTFAEKYGVNKVYREYDEMFTDPEVDIIYITTPHNTHIEFLRKALSGGKHVLCEKSITLNSGELDEAIQLAKENHVILAEAMTIWHMPLYKKLWDIVEKGELGKVQLLQLNFGSFKDYDMNNRFFNRNLAGGAMLDIGVYSLSLMRSFMQSKPEEIKSFMNMAPSGVDETDGIVLRNKEKQMATIMLSLHSKQPKRAVISCENGYIEIMEYPRGQKAIIVDANTGEVREVRSDDHKPALQFEMEDMEKAVLTGDAKVMKLDYTRDVMEMMTKLREEWGMRYPEEEKE